MKQRQRRGGYRPRYPSEELRAELLGKLGLSAAQHEFKSLRARLVKLQGHAPMFGSADVLARLLLKLADGKAQP